MKYLLILKGDKYQKDVILKFDSKKQREFIISALKPEIEYTLKYSDKI